MKPNVCVTIRQATPADAPDVGHLVARLLDELSGDLVPRETATLEAVAADLLASAEELTAFLAFDGDRPVAVMTLSACASVYAGGRFGETAELYVEPAHRSADLGRRLIEQAKAHAVERGWTRLEVGAPDQPRWARTLTFYRNNGFSEVGPRLAWPAA